MENQQGVNMDSTIIEFYNHCCEKACTVQQWNNLPPQIQIQFTQAVDFMQQVIYAGGVKGK